MRYRPTVLKVTLPEVSAPVHCDLFILQIWSLLEQYWNVYPELSWNSSKRALNVLCSSTAKKNKFKLPLSITHWNVKKHLTVVSYCRAKCLGEEVLNASFVPKFFTHHLCRFLWLTTDWEMFSIQPTYGSLEVITDSCKAFVLRNSKLSPYKGNLWRVHLVLIRSSADWLVYVGTELK